MNTDRFKFRAFIKSQRMLVYLKWFCIEDDGTVSLMTVDGRLMNLKQDDVILEQCTGLKDKHGKLIYEGDILGGSNGSINGIEWPYKTTVTWDAGQHRFVMPNWAWNDNGEYEGGRTHYVEIIGNIHESEAKSE